MTYIDFFQSLRVHRNTSDLKTLSDTFPMIIAQVLKYLSVYTEPKVLRNLQFTNDSYLQFLINFGTALYTQNFTTLDDILLLFLEKYYIYTHPCQFYLTFPESAKKKFNSDFDAFRDKQWNKVIDPMLDSIIELLKTGKIAGKYLNLD